MNHSVILILMFYVYLLYSVKLSKWYVGYTHNLRRRFEEHNRRGNKFTDYGIPWKLIYYEAYLTKNLALSREKQLKNQPNVYHYLKKRLEKGLDVVGG